MPRAGLTREKVVREAAAVADDVGWDRLSLAALAERLGVRQPSLYKHVASLDDLRAALATQSTRELGEVLTTAAVGRTGEDALRATADAYRRYGQRHPGRYAATVRAPRPEDGAHTAATEAVLQTVLAVLTGYGLDGDDAIDAARALRAALHGFLSLEASRGFGLPHDVDRSFRRLVSGLHLALTHWAVPSDAAAR